MQRKANFQIYLLGIFILFSGNLFAQSETKKTEILILGTPHLSQIEKFHPNMLDNLIKRLDSESFDAVFIENMPAELLYDIRSRNDSAFAEVISRFGGRYLSVADSVQKQLGISFLDAQKRFSELSKKEYWSDKEHLLMIEYSVATANTASAALHYYLLQDKTIVSQSSLSENIYEDIVNNIESSNEIYALALNLAANQRLNKIESIDNFQDEALLLKHFPNFIQDFTDNQELFKDIGKLPLFSKSSELLKQAVEKGDLYEYYLFVNSEEYMKQDFEAQWEIWLKTNFPTGTDKARYYLWEMRNLQIAANIIERCSFYPGKKIIVIIGSSHKSFLEKYLKQISDIEILNFD